MASAAYTKHLEGLARAALNDFEYPSRDAEGRANDKLIEAIERAIDRWIKKNCQF